MLSTSDIVEVFTPASLSRRPGSRYLVTSPAAYTIPQRVNTAQAPRLGWSKAHSAVAPHTL